MRCIPPLPVENPRSTSKVCQIPGCPASTREGKPYCSDHVDQNPYATQLLESLAELEREHAKVRRRGATAVRPDSPTSCEILRELEQQRTCSVARLAQILALPQTLVGTYVQGLARTGHVMTSGFRRDRLQVSLAQPANAEGVASRNAG